MSKDAQRTYLNFEEVYKEVAGPDGKIIRQFDPHATLDRALAEMDKHLRPPTAEILNLVINC